MLDQLINMGKQQFGQALKQKENLNDQQVNETFNVAQDSFLGGLKDHAMSGNISQLTSLFNGNTGKSTSLIQSILGKFVPQLSSKLGISPDKAGSIGNMIIPFLVEKFAGKETGTVNTAMIC